MVALPFTRWAFSELGFLVRSPRLSGFNPGTPWASHVCSALFLLRLKPPRLVVSSSSLMLLP